MRLYRPVGLLELQRIFEAGMRAFPPRLPDQPIFYPVLNQPYATQIARDWNTTSAPFAGYVTQFDVADHYVGRFEPQIVGSRQHAELWVPADELATFNTHIVAPILVVAAYFGESFRGYVPERFMLCGLDAVEQLAALDRVAASNRVDLLYEVRANSLTIFLHYAFWQRADAAALGVADAPRADLLATIQNAWSYAYPELALPSAG